MGKRTGDNPQAKQGLLMRMCHALDLYPKELAIIIGVPLSELEPLFDERNTTRLEPQKDDTWWKIKAHADQQIAMLLAVSAELDRMLQKDRTRQAARLALALERPKRSSPR